MSQVADTYERARPLIIWLGLVELTWIGFWLIGYGPTTVGYMTASVAWIASMLALMFVVIYLGGRGFFEKNTRWFSNLVGFMLVLTIAVASFTTADVAREGLRLAASRTPDLQLVLFHVMRLLAVGTVIKYVQGQLPLHFLVFGSIPDLLFAISAVVVTVFATVAPLGRDFLIVWHLVGILVFFGPGISMFFSVPSPIRIYHSRVDTSLVFQFPMLLAPNFTVPLFAVAHLFALVKLSTAG